MSCEAERRCGCIMSQLKASEELAVDIGLVGRVVKGYRFAETLAF